MKSMRGEWRHFLTHPKLLVMMLAAAFIPMMYAGFFLGSVWDPYSKTDKLPVAVVNNDTGAVLQDKHIHIGDRIVAALKGNTALNWRFVDGAEAMKGVHSGRYYMRITIPKDFSVQAASLVSQQPQQSVLHYETTPAKNYVGSMISRQAAEKIESEAKKALTGAYATALLHNFNELAKGMDTAAGGAAQLQQGVLALGSGSQQLQHGLEHYVGAISQVYLGVGRLQQGLGHLQSGVGTLARGAAALESSLPSSIQIQQLRDGVVRYGEGMQHLHAQLNSPGAHRQLATAKQRASELRATVQTINQALANIDADSTRTLLTTLQDKVASAPLDDVQKAELQALIVQLSQRTKAVDMLMSQLQVLRPRLAGVAIELDAVIRALDQASQVQQAVLALTLSYGQLQDGILSSLQGYDMLRPVVSRMALGSQQLTGAGLQAGAGIGSLQQGMGQLVLQSQPLLQGIARLQSGTTHLQQGANELAVRLRDGAARLAIQPTGDATARHIASPVSVKESEIGTVKNYGHALAPYVQSLALYIGAIVFNLLYPVRKLFTKPKNGFSWWLAKASVAAAISFLQAMVIGLLSMWILGLEPTSFWHYITMLHVTSLAYMAIVMFLSMVFDNVGRFMALLLLVVQLGGSEGTFPIELSNSFFQSVHPYLPMSHSVAGLREAISGGLGVGVFWSNFAWLLGVTIIFSLLLILALVLRKNRTFRHDVVTE